MKTDLLCGAGFQPADRISSGPPAQGRRMRLQRSGPRCFWSAPGPAPTPRHRWRLFFVPRCKLLDRCCEIVVFRTHYPEKTAVGVNERDGGKTLNPKCL